MELNFTTLLIKKFMKANFHLTNKAVFTILLNKASYKNTFVLVTRKKVPKSLTSYYESIDNKIVPLQRKDVFLAFQKKYNW